MLLCDKFDVVVGMLVKLIKRMRDLLTIKLVYFSYPYSCYLFGLLLPHASYNVQIKPISFQQEEDKDNPEMDEQVPESEERMEHETQGQTGQENLQSDSAVELAGEASERDQSKEVSYVELYELEMLDL